MTTKLAVPPTPPVAVAESAVPQTWQEAFNYLTDRFMKVVGRQAATIKDLTAGLEDARGVIAAGDRARAELQTKLDGVTVLIDNVRDSFSVCLTDQEKTLSERLTIVDDFMSSRFRALENSVMAVTDRVDTGARERAELSATVAGIGDKLGAAGDRLAALGDRLDANAVLLDTGARERAELSATVAGIGDKLGAAGDRLAALDATVEREVSTLTGLVERVAGLAGTVDTVSAAVEQETRARAAAVAAVARQVEEYAETASQVDGELCDKLDKLGERADTTTENVETILGRMEHYDGEITGRFNKVDETVAAVRRDTDAITQAIGEDRARLDKVEDGIAGFVRVTAAAGAEIRTFETRLNSIGAEAADACRRVTIALGEQPAAMMIDKNGHLIRVSRSGDTVDLGCVVVNGRDAADIVAARVEKGRLVFTRSDRTEFGCEMPAAAPAVVPDTVSEIDAGALGYLSKDPNVRAVQVEIMQQMRTAGKTYKQIGDKFGTSARQVVRLIKEGGK